MIQISNMDVDGKKVLDLCVEISDTYPLLIMIGNKGIVVSRHFNLAITEEYGIVAVMVFEARSFDDLLQKKVDVPNARARQLGIEKGMSVSEALKILA